MNQKQIRDFIAQRLYDVASFNGCIGPGKQECTEESPNDPVVWCKYCVQGKAAELLKAEIHDDMVIRQVKPRHSLSEIG